MREVEEFLRAAANCCLSCSFSFSSRTFSTQNVSETREWLQLGRVTV